jgi:hypothetical protein
MVPRDFVELLYEARRKALTEAAKMTVQLDWKIVKILEKA